MIIPLIVFQVLGCTFILTLIIVIPILTYFIGHHEGKEEGDTEGYNRGVEKIQNEAIDEGYAYRNRKFSICYYYNVFTWGKKPVDKEENKEDE